MIEVIGGDLYQWDISRSVRIKPEQGKQVQKANFSNADIETARVTSAVKDGDYYIADIPDELLKSDQKLTCYAVMIDPDEEKTIEQASFKVNRRNRPDDYDINASTELRSMCDDILGEVVGNTIFDKLEYMKDCLDILYQSPPIKLMREAYGKNTKFKDFCKNIVQSYENNWSVIGHKITYSSDMFNSGFGDYSPDLLHPNGMHAYLNKGFVCPEVYYMNGNDQNVKFTISAYNTSNPAKTLTNLDILDFRNVAFPVYESTELFELFNLWGDGNGFGFTAECTHVDGVYLPKLSIMNEFNFIDCTDSYPSISQGLHLGQIFMRNNPRWLFRYKDNVSPSLCGKTPVYCDKNFIGDVYLEKLNIDTNCFVDLFNNLAPLTGEAYFPEYGYFQYDFSPMIFSIGNYNIQKINNAIQDGNGQLKQALDNATAKGWDIQ